jgi:hypothetical protein
MRRIVIGLLGCLAACGDTHQQNVYCDNVNYFCADPKMPFCDTETHACVASVNQVLPDLGPGEQ